MGYQRMEETETIEHHHSRRNHRLQHGDMCLLYSVVLIQYQEEVNIHHFHHPHYGGRGHNGYHRNHQAGLPQRSTLLQTTWKLEMYKLHLHVLKKILHKDFPSSTDSFELLYTADVSPKAT